MKQLRAHLLVLKASHNIFTNTKNKSEYQEILNGFNVVGFDLHPKNKITIFCDHPFLSGTPIEPRNISYIINSFRLISDKTMAITRMADSDNMVIIKQFAAGTEDKVLVIDTGMVYNMSA